MSEELIKYWTNVINSKNKKFISDNDYKLFVENRKEGLLIQSDYQHELSESDVDKKAFHINLLPAPYCGDLENSDIYILLANPGFSYLDYYDESCKKYREAVIKNLKQEKTEYMNPCFNPDFLWTGGARYWNKKLDGVMSLLLRDCIYKNHLEGFKDFSNRITTLELIPYHSTIFSLPKCLNELDSKKKMLEFVYDVIITKAKSRKALVIIGRRASDWGIEEKCKNIIKYNKSQAQSFSLSPASEGGKAIIEWIKQQHKNECK